MLTILALIVLILCLILGLALALLSMMGPLVIALGAILYNLITATWTFSLSTLLLLLGIGIAAELLEWVITLFGLGKNTSKHGVLGALFGAILGASVLSFIPFFGTILGLFIGGFLGTYLAERQQTTHAKALRSAYAFFISRLWVGLMKVTLGIVQLIILFMVLF